MNTDVKTRVVWLVIAILVVAELVLIRTRHEPRAVDLSFTELMYQIDQGRIKSVTISGTDLKGDYKDTSEELHAVIPPGTYQPLVEKLVAKGVNVTWQQESSANRVYVLINATPFLLLVGMCISALLLGFRILLRRNNPVA